LYRLIQIYLRNISGKEQEFFLGEKQLKTLRLSIEERNLLLSDFRKLRPVKSPLYRKWEAWLKGNDQHLAVTFDSECASDHPEASFLMPLHPLVRQAAESFNIDKNAVAKLSVVSDNVSSGQYKFAIYQWKLHGIREDQKIKVVTENESINVQIEELLKNAIDWPVFDIDAIPEDSWKNLEQLHYSIWINSKSEHIEENNRIINYQRESLSTSHKARIALLNDLLQRVEDEKIRRMRQKEIENAESDYARHIQDLDIAGRKADIEFEPVAYGIIKVEKN